jgi:hypothetical protein
MNMIEESIVETQPQERSWLATAALVCSLIICCPITTIIGPILGLISLFTLKGRSGKGFALTAIIVGLISTVIWIAIGVFAEGMATRFLERTGEVTSTTIQAGYDGDYVSFRHGLTRSSTDVSDEEIASFIEELQRRYGTFDSANMNLKAQDQSLKPAPGEVPIPIIFVFETTDVSAEVLFEVIPKGGLEYELKLGCIHIIDAQNGNLIFPKDSNCDSTWQDTLGSPPESEPVS